MRIKKNNRLVCLTIYMLLLVLCLEGCTAANPKEQSGFQVYYINKQETKVIAEPYEPEGQTTEELIIEMLAVLETDPQNTELKKPIDVKTNVLDYSLAEGQLVIDFDENYYTEDAAREVLCRAAIVKTMCQIDGVDCVSFIIKGEPLRDTNEKTISVMTAESFIDNTGNEINSYEKANLNLYFANETGTALIQTVETVAYSSNISMEKLVTEQVIEGPKEKGMRPTVTPTTKILGATIKDGICYLNLSADFLTLSYPVSEEMVIYSLVNSLTELPNVNKVQISIDGESDMYFGDHILMSTIFERNLEIVEKE